MKTPGLRHILLRESGRFSEVKHAGQKVAGRGQLAWRRLWENMLLGQRRASASPRRCAKALVDFGGLTQTRPSRMCQDRQVEVGASEVSCVSLDRVDGPWPS